MSVTGLRARVSDVDGWGITHAVLTVTDIGGNQVARVAANADGVVATESLPPGSYTAILTAPGFKPVARTAVVSASGSASLGAITLASDGELALPEVGTWTIDPVHSAISVTARHLGLSSVRGRFNDFGGRIEVREPTEASTVHATIQPASIDTANKMRDDHLRSPDFLEVDEYPVITFIGSGLRRRGLNEWELIGELQLHGRSRAVRLDLTYLGTEDNSELGTRAAFRASTRLDRHDFAINYSAMVRAGIAAVGTTLNVTLDIQAVRGDSLPTI